MAQSVQMAAVPFDSMPPLTFGFAGPDDTAAVVDLVQSAYRGDRSRRGWTFEADLLDGQRIDAPMLGEVLATPDAVVLTARRNGLLLACCEIRPATDALTAVFGMFAVDPEHQAGGIGSQVLIEAERIATTRLGSVRMELTVIDRRHELIAWYRRRGYRPTGETRPFPHGDERFGLPRYDDLQFVVLEKTLPSA